MGKNRKNKVSQNDSKPHDSHENSAKKQAQLTAQVASFSGPLPPPAQLDEYGIIDRSFPERIFKMAESEMNHRHSMEKMSVDASIEMTRRDYTERRIGQIFGLLIGVVAIGCGTYAVISGHQISGTVIGAGGVVGLVSAFIYGRKTEKEESE